VSTKTETPPTLQAPLVCPVCGSHDHTQVYQAKDFFLLKCNECTVLRKGFDEALSSSTVQALQDSVYVSLSRNDLAITRRMASLRLALLKEQATGGSLLEIGCATGEFLEQSKDGGFDVLGIDTSERYSEYAKEKGLNIRTCKVESLVSEAQTFEIATMFHLFEHIENPDVFLRNVSNVLTENGLLMIVLPNLASRTDRFFRYLSHTFHQADHLYFYDKNTLSRLLESNGFDVVAAQSKEYLHHPITTLQCALGRFIKAEGTKGTAGDQEVQGTQHSSTPKWIRLAKKNLPYWLAFLLSPILWPYTCIVDKKCEGHELIMFARKRQP
jgi:ubiquinone/menaquinone biosynthesis C-methylase UbiE